MSTLMEVTLATEKKEEEISGREYNWGREDVYSHGGKLN